MKMHELMYCRDCKRRFYGPDNLRRFNCIHCHSSNTKKVHDET